MGRLGTGKAWPFLRRVRNHPLALVSGLVILVLGLALSLTASLLLYRAQRGQAQVSQRKTQVHNTHPRE